MTSAAPSRPAPSHLDLALLGNGRVASLHDTAGRIVWCPYPRFDGDPLFCRLLTGDDEVGFFDVVLEDMVESDAQYVRNTAILVTTLRDRHGNAIRVVDFAPRFKQYGRQFHPSMLMRRIEPVQGLPRIAVRMRPCHGWGAEACVPRPGSSHIRYEMDESAVRLTTDAPLPYLLEETTFALNRPVHFALGVDEPFGSDLAGTWREFHEKTLDYWLEWVRYLAVPYEWQDAVIRAAITLKLCQFEDTGAIVAAHTTSIPEAPHSERNWDYRFCWLRDAYFVVQALNRLGVTRTMENYLDYITTVTSGAERDLKPVYGIVPDAELTEYVAPHLSGYRGFGPVRIGNAAADQVQNDVYGSVILAVQQTFLDDRLPVRGDAALFRHLERLGRQAVRLAFVPDAGIWEYRGRTRIHSHSTLLCWAACDRLGRVARRLGLVTEAQAWAVEAEAIRKRLLAEAWDERRGAFTGALGYPDLDAAVLLFGELGLVAPDDPRFVRTVDVIGRELSINGHLLRYAAPDDFGVPETAFLVCRFWYLDALAAIGRRAEARAMFEEVLARRNRFGLLSEDLHPETGEMWGNLPQTYSMAGIVLSAMRLSTPWEAVL